MDAVADGKSLEQDGFYTREVVMCLGLVEARRAHMSQRSIPYIMGIHSLQRVAQLYWTSTYTTEQPNELVGSRKIQNTKAGTTKHNAVKNKFPIYSMCNLHRKWLFAGYHCYTSPLTIDR